MKVETTIHFRKRGPGNRRWLSSVPYEPPIGRIPLISKLMALAIQLDEMIRSGQAGSYAELARLGE